MNTHVTIQSNYFQLSSSYPFLYPQLSTMKATSPSSMKFAALCDLFCSFFFSFIGNWEVKSDLEIICMKLLISMLFTYSYNQEKIKKPSFSLFTTFSHYRFPQWVNSSLYCRWRSPPAVNPVFICFTDLLVDSNPSVFHLPPHIDNFSEANV